jgi:hypothetical protein
MGSKHSKAKSESLSSINDKMVELLNNLNINEANNIELYLSESKHNDSKENDASNFLKSNAYKNEENQNEVFANNDIDNSETKNINNSNENAAYQEVCPKKLVPILVNNNYTYEKSRRSSLSHQPLSRGKLLSSKSKFFRSNKNSLTGDVNNYNSSEEANSSFKKSKINKGVRFSDEILVISNSKNGYNVTSVLQLQTWSLLKGDLAPDKIEEASVNFNNAEIEKSSAKNTKDSKPWHFFKERSFINLSDKQKSLKT